MWSRLYHQGGVYSASYAALPALADMSLRREPKGYVAAVHLAAAIIASNEGPADPALMRRRYQRELSDLQAVAARNVPHATDDIEFVYGLEALMAFEDGGVWQRSLVCLANGEAELDCPACDEHLLLDLDGPDFQVASLAEASLTPTAATPVTPPAATVEGRLVALAQAHNRAALVTKLTYLLGDATCPRCTVAFHLPERFA